MLARVEGSGERRADSSRSEATQSRQIRARTIQACHAENKHGFWVPAAQTATRTLIKALTRERSCHPHGASTGKSSARFIPRQVQIAQNHKPNTGPQDLFSSSFPQSCHRRMGTCLVLPAADLREALQSSPQTRIILVGRMKGSLPAAGSAGSLARKRFSSVPGSVCRARAASSAAKGCGFPF